MRVISILNRKGGVGKTTTAVNLAAIFAQQGKRVLMVDIDSQANASTYLGVYRIKENTTYEMLCKEACMWDVIRKTGILGIDLCPSGLDLDQANLELASLIAKEYRLKKQLAIVEKAYDYVFIDCPAERSNLTINALAASDYAVLPCEPTEFGVDAMIAMHDFALKVRSEVNMNLCIAGFVFTKKKRTAIHREYAKQLREELTSYHFFDAEVRDAAAVDKSLNAHKPLVMTAPKDKVTQDYKRVAKELIRIMADKEGKEVTEGFTELLNEPEVEESRLLAMPLLIAGFCSLISRFF